MYVKALRLPRSFTRKIKYFRFAIDAELAEQIKSATKWLIPGLSIKRWLITSFLGISVITWSLNHLSDNYLWGIMAIAGGIFLAIRGQIGLIQSITQACCPDQDRPLVELLLARQSQGRGYNIVALGGGTGLSSILRGLKQQSDRVTAVVTVADDGGSSGRLREEFGVLPPGDIRNCLAALSAEESLLTQLFQYRFTAGDGLKGHSFGNLFLTAMSEITGNLETAIAASSQILAIRGQVLPATLANMRLWAKFDCGQLVAGESNIAATPGKIEQIGCIPANPLAVPAVIRAIESADCIILGPGSLYTSIIPNLLVPEIREAIAKAQVPRIYICNIMTQPGETDDYTVADHIQAIDHACGVRLFDAVVVNGTTISPQARHRYAQENSHPVILDRERVGMLGRQVIVADILDENPLNHQIRHHAPRLAQHLASLISPNLLELKSN